ncbi:hypothetical protein AAFF_G00009160 [Aldrovandia affinis]|uniref:Uncharacterized protein n=1 Tax=Aldrovandia affinis TaxID=143900 RepID=A0AAD7T796_9TELE|nr:hypothetical protein AAFF_G00009160 [Aldrovandia affinis]
MSDTDVSLHEGFHTNGRSLLGQERFPHCPLLIPCNFVQGRHPVWGGRAQTLTTRPPSRDSRFSSPLLSLCLFPVMAPVCPQRRAATRGATADKGHSVRRARSHSRPAATLLQQVDESAGGGGVKRTLSPGLIHALPYAAI